MLDEQVKGIQASLEELREDKEVEEEGEKGDQASDMDSDSEEEGHLALYM